MQNKAKIIFHIDMNMFFCSVAVIKYPNLKGKAFAIGRDNAYKGVISSASYEARKFGIHAAMPTVEALKIKPDLIILNADFKAYEYYHNKFISLIKEYTDIIEVASIDEVYADMTDISKTIHPIELAKTIQKRLVKEYHLPSSIGIAPTLFLAKMASDIKKPMGITVLRKREVEEILYPLSVKEIFGIGKKTYPLLIDSGIKTIADFMDITNKKVVVDIIGDKLYEGLINAISGNSSNVVDPERYSNTLSISSSVTFDNHLNNYDELLYRINILTKDLYKKLIDEDYFTKTITLTLRDESFKTITRSKSIEYTNDLYDIEDTIVDLFDSNFVGQTIRLVGVSFSNLKKSSDIEIEYNLFTYQNIIEKEEKIRKIMDTYNKKYGDDFISIGLKNDKS